MTGPGPAPGPASGPASGPAPGSGGRDRRTRDARVWRLPVLVLVILSLLAAGLVDRAVRSRPEFSPATPASLAAPAGAESSNWYCAAGTGTPGGAAGGTLYLVNVGPHVVTGKMTVVNESGDSGTLPVSVPAGGEITTVPGDVVHGNWLSSTVALDGGGVTVSEMVDGSQGWAEDSCASTTSPSWYFDSGSTGNGSTFYVSLYNPTTTVAVVDLTFVTPDGLSMPPPFEGLVLAPGRLVVAGVASYVQDQPSVSTIVQARSGRVVAEEIEEHAVGGVSGLSLRLGSPAPESRWILPRTVNVAGGRTEMVVLNPSSAPQRVVVHIKLASGPVAPYVHEIPSHTTWTLVTSSLIRIPLSTDYAVTVTSSGGPGVVVGRVIQSSSAGVAPQWGAVNAVPAVVATVPAEQWVLPSPAAPASPISVPETQVEPVALALENPGGRAVNVSILEVAPAGDHHLAHLPVLRIPPGSFAVVEPTTLKPVGSHPLFLRSNGPLVAMEDGSPAGVAGVVSLAAIPLGK